LYSIGLYSIGLYSIGLYSAGLNLIGLDWIGLDWIEVNRNVIHCIILYWIKALESKGIRVQRISTKGKKGKNDTIQPTCNIKIEKMAKETKMF
jgi:hypothetical protein